MATGKSSYFDLDCTSSLFKIRINWSESYDASTNSSTVTISSVQFKSTEWAGFSYYPDGVIKVNGAAVITMNSTIGTHNCKAGGLNTWASIKDRNGTVATGSATVVHDADGTKSITIEVAGNRFGKCYFYTISGDGGGSGWGCTGSSKISLTDIQTYTLSVSAGTGSNITVNRTASGYAKPGNITAGTRLYYGDTLKIIFSPSANYKLLTTKVNNSSFTSGNAYTVTANVSVSSTAQILASDVGATNADIGSVSTITVTKYNNAYYHSLQYSFGDLSGYITSAGGVQSSEIKFSGSSVAFSVPTDFYSQIPNKQTGICTITCRTYESPTSTTVLGNATSCSFTVTAAYANCVPMLDVSIVDTNATTIALTGNARHLIKYMSTAQCTINATRRNFATISSMSIAGSKVTGAVFGDVTTGTKTFTATDKESFAFSATDSREYTAIKTVAPTVVKYTKLTCNPIITRPTPTGSSIVMTFSGNVYRGSFGAYSNTLTLQYRYKKGGGSYGSWKTIDSSNVVFGAYSYRSANEIELQSYATTNENGDTVYPGFDYHSDYEFQIRATDGAGSYTLSTVDKYVTVNRGIPVFDWGENDFNINVALMLKNTNILDIMYPVGSVYMHSNNVLPAAVSNVGTWSSVTTEIDDVYAWKRTS